MITFLKLGKYGRIGNQLFQVASTLGVANRNGHLAVFPEWDHPFNTIFNGLNGHPEEDFEVMEIPWGYWEIEIHPSKLVSLEGYLQSEWYFSHCEDWIRELFTFRRQMDPGYDFIAVHVRRGDYKDKQDYHTLLGPDYYSRALDKMPGGLPIILFSDDLEEAKEIVPDYTNTFHSPNPWMDLQMMSKASHHIIANSSFSWWGAWLSGSDQVIAPGDWFGPKSSLNIDDLIPERWEIIY